MAVAHVTSSQSHASGSFSVSQASFNWTHTTSTDPQGVLILVFQGVSATDAVTSVTYDGVTIPAVAGGAAHDTATELGSVEAFFLGSGIPTTDNPTVVVNRTNNTTTMWAVCTTVTAATDTEVAGIVLVEENGTIVEQSVNDGSTGVDSVRYSGVYYGGATPAPAGANSTLLGTTNDAGAYGWTAVRETTAGQGARSVGCTQATSDDRAIVALAVREFFASAKFDSASTQSGGSTASISWSHTCSGTDRVLLVDACIGTSSGGDTKTTTVTYNGVSMTSIGKRHSDDATAGFVERFLLVNPASGANTVQLTINSSAIELIGGAQSFNGASQTAGDYLTTDGAGQGTAAVATAVTPAATSMVMGGHGGGSAFSAVGQTSRYNISGSNSTGCGNLCGNTAPGTGSNVSVTATLGSDNWVSFATEIPVASSGGNTGTAAVTEAADTSAASGQLGYSGTSARTEANDTSSASGTVVNPVTGTSAAAQASQTTTASGQLGYSGSASPTQASQTGSASGTVGSPVTGTTAATQAAQTSTASGQLGYAGTSARTQANQVPTASGQLGYSGTASASQAANTANASGTFTPTGISGSVSANQAANTSAASGQLGYSGTSAAIQAANTAAASGTFTGVFTGTAAASQAPNTSTAAGQLGYTGAASATQAAQISAASGTFTSAGSFTGAAAPTQANQTSAATGQLGYSATATPTQASNASAASGTVVNPVSGAASPAQANQTSTASGKLGYTGTVSVTKGNDTSSATGTASPPISGTGAAAQVNQTAIASGTFAPLVAYGTAHAAVFAVPTAIAVPVGSSSSDGGSMETGTASSGSMTVPSATGG